jgi:hypothetical protein
MTSEKVDVDPLQMALDEAQELMESLGSDNIDGFAIDSDDEEIVPWDDPPTEITDADASNDADAYTGADADADADANAVLDPLSMTATSVSSTTSSTYRDAGAPQSIAMHPLQDDFLQVAAPSPLPLDPSIASAPYLGGISMNGTSTATESSPSSDSSLFSSLHASSISSTNHNGMGASNPHTNNINTAASLDAFKAQTSRFANTFATFAQRAASQVVGVPTTPTEATSPFSSSGAPMLHHQNSQTPTTTSSTTAPSNGQVMPMQAMVHADLDNEQKATLIQTHVGELLPGERVIMFLSNLLHVSDSSGFQYSYQAQPSTSMWCCAMTYYRLIIFATHPVSSISKPADWNAACWPPVNGQPSILEMPLARYVRFASFRFGSKAKHALSFSVD